MSVVDTARKQYAHRLDEAAKRLSGMVTPPEGWLSSMRKALRMSGATVAARAGVTRAAIYQAERNEREGAITIRQMEKLAEAMGGRFVYAIVPDGSVGEVMRAQALRKARARIGRAGAHMALEDQALSPAQAERRIESLADDLLREMPPDFWTAK